VAIVDAFPPLPLQAGVDPSTMTPPRPPGGPRR
jgi:hypothetical protein